jgi:hypothetical protein
VSFEDRWMEFGLARVPDPPWADVWALVHSCRALGHGLGDVEDALFRWRWSGWILQLASEPSTCLACGARMDSRVGQQTQCDGTCRVARFRRHARGEHSAWEQRVEEAKGVRAELVEAMRLARVRLVRDRILSTSSVPAFPPDWTVMQHAPVLPARCPGCAGGGDGGERGGAGGPWCAHTDGPCLFSGIVKIAGPRPPAAG